MKTELQKQFEDQTPTIRGRSRVEYLQTFVTWLHLQVEKNCGGVSDDDIGELVKEIVYKQHHEEQSEDFLEKVWIVKEWLQSLPKTKINKDTLYRKIYCEKRLPNRDGKYNTDIGELYLSSDLLSRKWRTKTGLGYVGVYYPEWWLENPN